MTDGVQSIQVFRGVAASAVIVHHAFNESFIARRIPLSERNWFFNTDVGAAGVDLFFIISGFIMFYTTACSRPAAWRFLLQRVIRIYPLYWIASIAGVLVLISPWIQDYDELRNNAGTYLKSALLYPTIKIEGTEELIRPRPVGQGWTLVYEMVFYLVFAALLRLGRIRHLVCTSLALLVLWAGSHLLPNGPWRLLLSDSILLEFSLGIAIAGLLTETSVRLQPGTSRLLAALGFAGLAAAAMIPGYMATTPRLLHFGLPCFLIAASFVLRRGPEPVYPRWLLIAGDASYSLYLTHGLAMLLIRIGYSRMPALQAVPPWAYILLLLSAVFPIGLLTYYLIEHPVTRFLKHRLLPAKPTTTANPHASTGTLG